MRAWSWSDKADKFMASGLGAGPQGGRKRGKGVKGAFRLDSLNCSTNLQCLSLDGVEGWELHVAGDQGKVDILFQVLPVPAYQWVIVISGQAGMSVEVLGVGQLRMASIFASSILIPSPEIT